jgi:hypothetical protein
MHKNWLYAMQEGMETEYFEVPPNNFFVDIMG